jgi:hypothetical protein
MNHREAGYVRHLIDHLLTPGSVDADDMEEAVTVLAARAHDMLGTGPDGPAVALLWEQSQQTAPTWTVARPALADCERRVPTWTVAPADPDGGGRWEIRADGMLADTVAAHYDVAEVLAVAERYAAEHHAGRPLAWVLDPTLAGFRSVTAGEVAAL